MIALSLAAAFLSAFTLPVGEVEVHEWGVVLYTTDSTMATGSPGYDPMGAICADAPVVYFHGSAFTGDVAVCSLGRIFATYPEPDESGGPMMDLGGLGSMARWEDLSVGPDQAVTVSNRRGADDILVPGYDWALGLWRVPASLWIDRAEDGFSDRFLYYEVDLTGTGFPLPLEGFASESTPGEQIVHDMLVFRRHPDGSVSCEDASDESDMPFDPTTLVELDGLPSGAAIPTIREWVGGSLTEEEIQSMWATWEPYILYGEWRGDRLAVFPIPQTLVERISIIVVTPDSGIPVSSHRFFLGMKAI